jgi:RNA polymerase sigma-70 factor (ECF subfamily)
MVVLTIDTEKLARRQQLRGKPQRAYGSHRAASEEAELAGAVAAAQRGDADAFEFLFLRFSPRVRALLLRLSSDEHEAEDLLQLVVMRVLAKIHLYRAEEGPFLPWLLAVARNVAMDQLRQRRPTPSETVSERDRGVEDDLEGRSRSLCHAFSMLPEDQRSVALLRYVRGLSPGEIAIRLGRSEPSIYGLQNRAQTALRARLIELECVPSVAA